MGMMNRKIYANHKVGSKVVYKTETGTDSKCKQEFREETDLNQIVARFLRTGKLPNVNEQARGVFADVTQIGDFGDVLRRSLAGKEAFASLPAKIRSRFENDPVQFVEFLQDPANRKEAEDLGLVKAAPPPPPAPPAEKPPA